MKSKSVLWITLAILGMVVSGVYVYVLQTDEQAFDNTARESSAPVAADESGLPYQERELFSGEHTSSLQFQDEENLEKNNGPVVNFWVKNNGKYEVHMKIDNWRRRILMPGESGYLSEQIEQLQKDASFRVTAGKFGGPVSIEAKISQGGKWQQDGEAMAIIADYDGYEGDAVKIQEKLYVENGNIVNFSVFNSGNENIMIDNSLEKVIIRPKERKLISARVDKSFSNGGQKFVFRIEPEKANGQERIYASYRIVQRNEEKTA